MKKKFTIWMTGTLASLFVILAAGVVTNEYLVKSDTVQVNSDRWNSIISKEINKEDIKLSVDGNLFEKSLGEYYVNENLIVMISVEDVSAIFDCAENLYQNKKLVVEKGTTRVEMQIGSNNIKVNEKEVETAYCAEEKNGKYFIPVTIFTEYFGYSYRWDGKTYIAELMNEEKDVRALPYYYSYEKEKKAPKVRSQGNFGSCWAFASLTALESSLRPEENTVFSVDHMVLKNSFIGGMNDGGDYTMSMAYLAAWQGPVSEKVDPYDGKTEDYEPVKHVQEIQIVDSKNLEEIKKMIYKYGGVQSSLYTSLINSSSTSTYYNNENYSYCYIGENKPNHDVVIIGWDDNYPKENFNVDVEEDGAFICRNSWGTEFGEEGNFYVSYYDSNIGVHNIVYTGIEEVDNYNNIYQTDLCGWVGSMGYKGENSAYFANVYTSKGNEELAAVSFYATDKDTEYEVYVCTDYKGTESLSSSRIIAASGLLQNVGYYTVKLNGEYKLTKGQKYAVIVKAVTPNSTKPIAVEFVNDERTSNVDLSDGEGYISLRGVSWENVEKNKECNICLKAFTR